MGHGFAKINPDGSYDSEELKVQSQNGSTNISTADELIKLKGLLDAGAIS